MPSAGSPTFKTNSTATIPKATYVPLLFNQNDSDVAARSGGAVRKFGFIRNLNLQPGEVDAVRAELASNAAGNQASALLTLAKIVRRFAVAVRASGPISSSAICPILI